MTHSAIVLHLLMPPSANRLWRNVNGRMVKSAEYRTWMQSAGADVLVQRARGLLNSTWPKSFTTPVRVHIWAGRPDKRKRDIDNRIKPLLDCLTQSRVIQDDSLVHSLTIEWAEGVSGVRVEVWPYEAKQGGTQ